METEINNIEQKIKSDNFDIPTIEKSISKLEKKINKIESEFNGDDSDSASTNSNDSDSEPMDITEIIKNIEQLEKKLSDANENDTIENIIELYNEFKLKLKSIKTNNENFKLSVEYI